MNRARAADRGTVSIYLVVVAVAVVAAAGLALDGGRKLAALSEVRAVAGNAARACAQAVLPSGADAGLLELDPSEGPVFAQAFATAGTSVSASVTGSRCTATASRTVSFRLLPGSTTVSATESAEAFLTP